MLKNKRITLLVSGSIAAYKSVELVREFKKLGADVNVVLSESAKEFVSPLSLQTVSGNRVSSELFDLTQEHEIGHINLADKADVIVCAPATANVLAKVAHGIADDLLTTVILASTCPVVFFPAMNVNMWSAKVTQDNVQKIRSYGHLVINPDSGDLACGWNGAGRLPELTYILEEVSAAFYDKILSKTKVLVTAGPTNESIDPVRFLTNRSSGKMGYELARAARNMGADVTLISGPTHLTPPKNVNFISVETSTDMSNEVNKVLNQDSSAYDVQLVYMAAAVSDHKPSEYSSKKLKMDKNASYSIEFKPSVDILSSIGQERSNIEKKSNTKLKIVGFAAETGSVEEMLIYARSKLERKSADYIIANNAVEAMGSDSSKAWVIDKSGKLAELESASKDKLAFEIIKRTF